MPLIQTHAYFDAQRVLIEEKPVNPILTPTLNRGKGNRRNPGISSFVLCAVLAFGITGCHSAYVNATVSNHTSAPISVVQVEYPSASFGTQTIAPGAEFKYRFKVLGHGPMKITYTDAAEREQQATGPTLTEGTEGPLFINVDPNGVHWQAPPAAH